MQSHKKTMLKKIIFIILILLSGGIFFFVDEIFTEPISDELLYRFKLGEHMLGEEESQEHIQTLKDVFISQYHQYFHTNGRYIVHVLVQAFDGLAPRWFFAIANTIVFLCVIYMLVAYTFRNKTLRLNPLIWIITVMIYFYAFPRNIELFMGIPSALNYLWGMMFVAGFLLLWEKYAHMAHVNPCCLLSLAAFSFITGWSQECFALPLSASILCYLIVNRKRVNRQMLIVAVALFIGASILTFAPGNFVRLSYTGRTNIMGYVLSVFKAVKFFLEMKIFWILVATIVWARFKGLNFRRFIAENMIVSLCLFFAILLGFVANTISSSFTGIEFFSLILIYRIVDTLDIDLDRRGLRICAVVFVVFFAIHQTLIAQGRRTMMKVHQNIVREYVDSPDGVILRPETHLPAIVRPFVPDWAHSGGVEEWFNYTISAYYGNRNKALEMLPETDFDILRNPSVWKNQKTERFPGSLGCIGTESCWWGRINRADTAASVRLVLYPVSEDDGLSWVDKLKLWFGNSLASDTIVKAMTSNRLYMAADSSMIVKIDRPFCRTVRKIDIVQ